MTWTWVYSPTRTPKPRTRGTGIWFGRDSILGPDCWSSAAPVSLSCPTLLSPLQSLPGTHKSTAVSEAPGCSEHRCKTAGLHPTGPGCWNRRGEPVHMQNGDTSISHTDIIPVFYLSPCNSFYILGLCSLACVQSQPRDTGLYQTHMCVPRSS